MNYAENYYYFRDSMDGLSIREILAHLNEVLKLLPGSIYLKDIDGVYLGCNEYQARMAGFDSSDLIVGKTDYQLPWKDRADRIRETDQRIIASGLAEEVVEQALTHDGQLLTMLSIKAPFYDEQGVIIGIVGTSLDITERVKAEQRELEALEEKRKIEETARRLLMVLAGSISHDLRSPLLFIDSLNRDLKVALPFLLNQSSNDAELTLKQKNALESMKTISDKIDDQIARMHAFINDNLKAIKQSTTNHLKEDDLVECQTYKMIMNALDSYPFQPNERDLIDWDRRYYFSFMGNPLLFMRVIFNLLSNSLYQINENGYGRIYISCAQTPSGNIIRFKDTAGGVSPTVLKTIFEGYVSNKKYGTGVGLAFCKMTMESFGGSISCHSTEGEYIEFILTFPLMDHGE